MRYIFYTNRVKGLPSLVRFGDNTPVSRKQASRQWVRISEVVKHTKYTKIRLSIEKQKTNHSLFTNYKVNCIGIGLFTTYSISITVLGNIMM